MELERCGWRECQSKCVQRTRTTHGLLHTLVETVTARGARGLDEPLALAQRLQPQLVRDLRRVHGLFQRRGIMCVMCVKHIIVVCRKHERYIKVGTSITSHTYIRQILLVSKDQQ